MNQQENKAIDFTDENVIFQSKEPQEENMQDMTQDWREQRDNQITHLQAQIKELEV